MTELGVIVEHDVTVHQGHVLDVLPQLPADSVNCIVTSPPYYGLRDYGTGTWDGGDPDCDHQQTLGAAPMNAGFNERWGNSSGQKEQETSKAQQFRDMCGKCGATRVDQQLGLEPSPAEYVESMRAVFAECRRVLAADGVLWLNIGDSYTGGGGYAPNAPSNLAGSKASTSRGLITGSVRSDLPAKNLLGVPWRVAFALQDDGWTLRNAVIWNKPNAMPESVTDRLSCRYEHVFLFSKSRRYTFDLDAIREAHAQKSIYQQDVARRRPHDQGKGYIAGESKAARADGLRELAQAGRNPGDVWNIPTSPYAGAHFATMPPELARRCILAGCPDGGTVLDPFAGSGTTLMTARKLGRKSVGIELNPASVDLIRQRIGQTPFDFGEVSA